MLGALFEYSATMPGSWRQQLAPTSISAWITAQRDDYHLCFLPRVQMLLQAGAQPVLRWNEFSAMLSTADVGLGQLLREDHYVLQLLSMKLGLILEHKIKITADGVQSDGSIEQIRFNRVVRRLVGLCDELPRAIERWRNELLEDRFHRTHRSDLDAFQDITTNYLAYFDEYLRSLKQNLIDIIVFLGTPSGCSKWKEVKANTRTVVQQTLQHRTWHGLALRDALSNAGFTEPQVDSW